MVMKKNRNRAYIECIFFSIELRINEVIEIGLKDDNRSMSFIDELVLSENYQILLARNKK